MMSSFAPSTRRMYNIYEQASLLKPEPEPAAHMTSVVDDKLISTKVHKLVKFLQVHENYSRVTEQPLPAAAAYLGQLLSGTHGSVGGGRLDKRLLVGSRAADIYLNVSLFSSCALP